ncbi:hypothetical protein LX36DRAFT_751601 [Colletotrichum falcatum]|nr:hypothetical protein LX36DRAFT_751601 [Colletotrichum falcatum]
MFSPKLILAAVAALLVSNAYAGCSDYNSGGSLSQNSCPGGQTFCGGIPNQGLSWRCCDTSAECTA